ncbi:hypothetical protein [Oceanidesulfovibrio marinus]|uniref:Uncharacterized protein n=1 Tax=Oceanidesulfovibrio marinus TaxID=370038 RepID=A0A6P1ZB57_9BACT|nr:hypothetical protein [Oceanidesulfovibrio marinus]TVM31153.1 hypothetical protein DQK91_18760 [Oceanidesulfovibrio marinus]
MSEEQNIFIQVEETDIEINVVEETVEVNVAEVLDESTTINNFYSDGGEIVGRVAGQDIGGHRVVVVGTDGLAYIADKDTPAHAAAVLGLSLGAVSSGAEMSIRTNGESEMSGWTWTPQAPVFLGPNGTLIQAPPTTGFILAVGFATAPTKIWVRIGVPIIL